jgi:Zn-dependent M32 family carboxypeptidase
VPSDNYQRFIALVQEIATLGQAQAVLSWDQETMMPGKGAAARANQLALLAGLAHEKQTSDELGDLLAKVEAEGDDDPVVATNVREVRRTFNRETKLPTQLVKDIARTTSLGPGDVGQGTPRERLAGIRAAARSIARSEARGWRTRWGGIPSPTTH